MEAVVVEETDWDYVNKNNMQNWKSYVKTCSENSCLWMRKGFDCKFIKRIHVVHISDGLQLVIHRNLHRNVHYSISDKRILMFLNSYCKYTDMKIAFYRPDQTYTKLENIIVMNNFSDNFKNECYRKLKPSLTLDKIKKMGKKRKKTNTTGWSIAPSGSYAGGWTQPRPDLDKFCTSGKLNKEGYNRIFPNDMKEGLSFALFLASSQMKILFEHKCSLFHHKERYIEFSKELESILLSSNKVYFEGGSMQATFDNFLPNLDTENCSEEGYNYSSVLSTKVNRTRVSWIGYNRK